MAVIDSIPLDRIAGDAREVQLGRLLATWFAAVFFSVGWVASKAFLAVAFAGVAVKAGWIEARKPSRQFP